MYNFTKLITLFFGLGIDQANQAFFDIKNTPIKISYADIVNENLNTHKPFRALLLKNLGHNLNLTRDHLKQKKYGSALQSLVMSGCSGITLLSYPTDNNWKYRFALKQNQSLILSAIALASCCDTVLKPTTESVSSILGVDSDNVNTGCTLAEIVIYAGICTIPFFNSFKYFALNVNK